MNALMLAFDTIVLHFRKFLFSVVLIFICLLLILFAIMAYHGQNLTYESCDNIVTKGVKKTGIIQITEENFHTNEITEFLNTLSKQEEIYTIGDCSEYCLQNAVFSELEEIQRKNKRETEEEEGLRVQYINVNTASMCELYISEGTPIKDLSFQKENVMYLYLGSAYTNIPIGTTYQLGDFTYIVAGILQKGQKWIKSDLINDFSGDVGDSALDCTYEVLGFHNQGLYCDYFWVTASDENTIEEAFSVVDKMAKKWEIGVRYASLQEVYEQGQSDTILLLEYLSRIIGIVLITSILMLVSLQVVFILTNLKEYGILYAVGFGKKEIFFSILWRNIISALLAFLFVIPCLQWIANKWFVMCTMKYLIKNIFLPYMLPVGLGIIIFVITIVSIVTNIVLNKFSPVQMMQVAD